MPRCLRAGAARRARRSRRSCGASPAVSPSPAIGAVMAALREQHAGRFDGKQASEIAKRVIAEAPARPEEAAMELPILARAQEGARRPEARAHRSRSRRSCRPPRRTATSPRTPSTTRRSTARTSSARASRSSRRRVRELSMYTIASIPRGRRRLRQPRHRRRTSTPATRPSTASSSPRRSTRRAGSISLSSPIGQAMMSKARRRRGRGADAERQAHVPGSSTLVTWHEQPTAGKRRA